MKRCHICDEEILDDAVICPHCGCVADKEKLRKLECEENDTKGLNVGVCVLAAIIPLFGLIYWALAYRKHPKDAQACGITVIISRAIIFLFFVLRNIY